MRISLFITLAIIAALSSDRDAAAEQAGGAGYEPMEIFAPLAGKVWRGEGAGPDGKPVVDIARYEMILGGRAFQTTHRLEDGSYGGRTIFFFDESAQKYIYHYFTTAGFHTIGVATPTAHGFDAVETVVGHPDIAELRSSVIFEGDRFRVVASRVDHDGNIAAGDGFVYRLIDDPGPLFDDAR